MKPCSKTYLLLDTDGNLTDESTIAFLDGNIANFQE